MFFINTTCTLWFERPAFTKHPRRPRSSFTCAWFQILTENFSYLKSFLSVLSFALFSSFSSSGGKDFPGSQFPWMKEKKLLLFFFFRQTFGRIWFPRKFRKKLFFFFFFWNRKLFFFLIVSRFFSGKVPFFILDAWNFMEGALLGAFEASTTQ